MNPTLFQNLNLCVLLLLKVSYPSIIISVEEIIHEQVATIQRSTLELSDLVDMISEWYAYEWRHLEQKRWEYNH